MGFYDENILPHVINLACGVGPVREQRAAIVSLARGRVLEVGIGTGLNLPFYKPDKVEMVWGLEPSRGMRKKARKNLEGSTLQVDWLDSPGEQIPLEDNAADTVLLTYTLCTIPDWEQALGQMRRVLKPNGRLLFSEHGLAPDPAVRKWQHRLTPLWKKCAGGCHLNRPIIDYLEQAGFKIETLKADYMRGVPRLAAFNYRGVATGN